MTGVRLTSSSLSRVAYQPEREWLHVEFVTGEVYRYQGVSWIVYTQLLQAASKGRYFNQRIRGHFPYENIGHLEN
jgi:hypothetical protein